MAMTEHEIIDAAEGVIVALMAVGCQPAEAVTSLTCAIGMIYGQQRFMPNTDLIQTAEDAYNTLEQKFREMFIAAYNAQAEALEPKPTGLES